jgi:diguanylate cyclase (GGDEF)-like protein
VVAKLLRPGISVRVGAGLFIGGAFCSVITMVLPHSEAADETGFYILGAFELLLGLIAWFLPDERARRWAPILFMVGGVIVVSGSFYFNGERNGGPATLTEIYYMWPALYAGYFLSRRWMIATLVLIACAYGGTMAVVLADPSIALTRWIVTMSVVVGCAFALHGLRLHVDGLLAALESAARTDPLTSMLNRRGFQEQFELELSRSARSGEPVTLLLGDIDRFKPLNDMYGHIAGDDALEAVGAALRGGCRAIDTAGRIGGEEFALLLPGASCVDGFEAAERLRAAVSMISRPDGDPLTISFGVVEHPTHGLGWSDLMKAADRALYAAKAGGRNQTVVAATPLASDSTDDFGSLTPLGADALT